MTIAYGDRIRDYPISIVDEGFEMALGKAHTPTVVAREMATQGKGLAIADVTAGTGRALYGLVDAVLSTRPGGSELDVSAAGINFYDDRAGSSDLHVREAMTAPGGRFSYRAARPEDLAQHSNRYQLVLAHAAIHYPDVPSQILGVMARIATPLGRIMCDFDHSSLTGSDKQSMDALLETLVAKRYSVIAGKYEISISRERTWIRHCFDITKPALEERPSLESRKPISSNYGYGY